MDRSYGWSPHQGLAWQDLRIVSVHGRDCGEWHEGAGPEHGLYPILRALQYPEAGPGKGASGAAKAAYGAPGSTCVDTTPGTRQNTRSAPQKHPRANTATALPAAQNIYVIASRYEVGELLARDSIFISTMLSVPTITLIAGLLGAG